MSEAEENDSNICRSA